MHLTLNARGRITGGGWKFERFREDKLLPNDIKTVQSIQVSVRDGVKQDELLSSLAKFASTSAR